MISITLAARSEAGGRSRNEDDFRMGEGRGSSYAVLSDGAGGHRDGAVASDIVVRIMALTLQHAEAPGTEALVKAMADANRSLVDLQQNQPPAQRMHATVVAFWVDTASARCHWAHAGDSRLYLLRRGEVEQLTRDHSLVQQLVDAGLLSAQDARQHPKKNQLLYAMGSPELDPQTCTATTDHTAEEGDAYLLCTDGWWGALEAEEFDTALARASSAQAWLNDMAATIAERSREGHDNYSAIAVWVGDPREVTRFG